MSYSAEINRQNPSCHLFVIDQSGSMTDAMPGSESETKADFLATVVNRHLQDLVIKCSKSEGVRDYFSVGVIGYGATVGPAFSGSLAGRPLVMLSEVADNPARLEDRTRKISDGGGGLVEEKFKLPIWFDAIAQNGTPMCQALGLAHTALANWLAEHPDCFPPVVLHFTDGQSTDGDPLPAMQAITSLSSSDGNVLLFSIHISSNPNAREIQFPGQSDELPDPFAQTLYAGSSPLTPFMRAVASEAHGMQPSDSARAFVMNAGPTLLIAALDIGTRPSSLR
jgi:hypothetical protein